MRIRRSTALLLLFLTALATIVHAPFQVVMRFRIPFTDPLLIALGAVGVSWLFARHRLTGENLR